MKNKPLSNKIINRFKEAVMVANKGVDLKGNRYSLEGMLNQAAWAGENCGCLLKEIERLKNEK